MKKLFKNVKKGFTIVELVIVIGVIAILSAILIPTFVNLNQKASEAALQSDLTGAYATYVADAADGVYEVGENKYDLISYEQKDIAISKGTGDDIVYYVRDVVKGTWDEAESQLATAYETVFGTTKPTDDNYKVGDYCVWHIK